MIVKRQGASAEAHRSRKSLDERRSRPVGVGHIFGEWQAWRRVTEQGEAHVVVGSVGAEKQWEPRRPGPPAGHQ